jgi:hypothetical protein
MKNKKGLTLVEMIIYCGLLTIILGLTANLFTQIASYRVNQGVDNALFANSSLIFDKISDDVKKAQSIETPADINYSDTLSMTLDEGTVNYIVEDGVLKRNNVDLSGNRVIVNVSGSERGFRKIDDTLQIKISIKSEQKRFGQPEKEKIYQTTIFYDE